MSSKVPARFPGTSSGLRFRTFIPGSSQICFHKWFRCSSCGSLLNGGHVVSRLCSCWSTSERCRAALKRPKSSTASWDSPTCRWGKHVGWQTKTKFILKYNKINLIQINHSLFMFCRLYSQLMIRWPRRTMIPSCHQCRTTCRTTRRPPGSCVWSRTNSLWWAAQLQLLKYKNF